MVMEVALAMLGFYWCFVLGFAVGGVFVIRLVGREER